MLAVEGIVPQHRFARHAFAVVALTAQLRFMLVHSVTAFLRWTLVVGS